MKGLILRPLSARLFSPTIPEQQGWVDRTALLSISGRSRKPQIKLARDKGINDYRCPAGGCLLTNDIFAARLRDYLNWSMSPDIADMPLLKIGRHFFKGNSEWIIVARNEAEGERLERMMLPDATLLLPTNFSAPVMMFRGSSMRTAIDTMRIYTHRAIPENAVLIQRQGSIEIRLPKSAWDETMIQTVEEA